MRQGVCLDFPRQAYNESGVLQALQSGSQPPARASPGSSRALVGRPACCSSWPWRSLRCASSGLLPPCSLRDSAWLRLSPPPSSAAVPGGVRSFAATSKLRPVFRGGKMKVQRD